MKEEIFFGKMSRLLTNKTFSATRCHNSMLNISILQITLNDSHL